MIETQAPEGGYNALTEAMRFEIYELTKEQAQTLYGSDSLKGFRTAETIAKEEIDNGTEDISELVKVEVSEVVAKAAAAEAGYDVGDYEKFYLLDGGKYYVYYRGNKDGIYPINVKNYTGITLPETGGMGTLLFTIIGVLLMLAAITVVLVKSRKTNME